MSGLEIISGGLKIWFKRCNLRTILFDLSEVFISGVYGVDGPIAELAGCTEPEVNRALNEQFQDILCGRITEQEYLSRAIGRNGWKVSVSDLKQIIRRNFHREVPGMMDLLPVLKPNYELALLSDHAVEWVEYIEARFEFLKYFEPRFYSYQLGQTKSVPTTFERVLNELGRTPEECIFVDDNPANIASAASIGLPGIHFQSVEQLSTALTERGVLLSD